MEDVHFTPTQQRILKVLSDGLSHSKSDLVACLGDDRAGPNTLSVHLTLLRRLLRPHGQDIVCEFRYGHLYRHIRLLHSANDGRR